MTTSSATAPARAQRGSSSWWFRSPDGGLTLWQLPNPALWVWLVTLVWGWSGLSAGHTTASNGIGRGALLVWALDELVRGASPFRRVLGAVVLASQLVLLVLG